MSSLETRHDQLNQTESVRSAWQKIRTEMEWEKEQLYEQIGQYPTPIAACDQQFNYLLDKQRQILQALARLNEAETESLSASDPRAALDEFLRTLPYSE